MLVGVWDGARLRQTFQQVVDNAIKFSPGGGEVSVCLDRADDGGRGCAVLTISDGGIGIPERDLPHVFDRFYRGENVVGRFKGAGLGLFEAQLDVVRHDGIIGAESSEGRGSIFTIKLPVAN